jgi:hypothetical protein
MDLPASDVPDQIAHIRVTPNDQISSAREYEMTEEGSVGKE